MTRRHRDRRLVLLGAALVGAAALAAVPLAIRAASGSRPACVGPQTAGAASVGTGIGAGAIALTVVPGGARLPVSIRMAAAPAGLMARDRLWLAGAGGAPIELRRIAPGCWGGTATAALVADVRVRTTAAEGAPTVAHFALPDPARSGATLLGRAQAATRRLAGLHEITLARRSVTAPPVRVTSTYIGMTVVSTGEGGIQRFPWPGWREGFEWMTPGIVASVVLGPTTVGGVRAERVAGAVAATPLWMEVDIDPTTGIVLADRMNGPHHVMSSTYAPIGG